MAPIDKMSFLKGKLAGHREHEIVLSLTNQVMDVDDYVSYKRKNLESTSMLSLDKLIEGTIESLEDLRSNGKKLFLLTIRRDKQNLLTQLRKLSIFSLFDDIIIAEPNSIVNSKVKVLEGKALAGCSLFGDSMIDYVCAKHYSMDFFHVGTGFERIENEHTYADFSEAVHCYLKGE